MFSKIIEIYDEADTLADPKVKKWFLMNSIWLPATIVVAYLYITLLRGPKLMKNRKAFDINKLILIYNVVQVIFNIFLLHGATVLFLQNIHSLRCFNVHPPDSELGHYQRVMSWWYMLNKLMDLLDTIFFVMKKKQSHVSFLHIYHHVLMFAGSWVLTKYYPGGMVVILGVLNALVHCVMYTYYLLSLMDEFKGITGFIKKHITQMQIAQFIIIAIHATYSATDQTCDYSKNFIYFLLSQVLLMIYLFIDFYRKSYTSVIHQKNDELQKGSLNYGLMKKTR